MAFSNLFKRFAAVEEPDSSHRLEHFKGKRRDVRKRKTEEEPPGTHCKKPYDAHAASAKNSFSIDHQYCHLMPSTDREHPFMEEVGNSQNSGGCRNKNMCNVNKRQQEKKKMKRLQYKNQHKDRGRRPDEAGRAAQCKGGRGNKQKNVTRELKPKFMTQEFKQQNGMMVDGRLLCRHYVLGRCIKGDECQLEHAQENDLIKEVCKFYVQGFCSRLETCPYMHNILWFARKKISCSQGDNCRFSHEPLNDLTKRLLDEALQREKELYEHMSKADEKSSGQPEDKEESKPSEPNVISQIPIQPLRRNFYNSTETNNENGASHEEKPVDDADQPPVSSDHSQPVCYSVEAVLGSQISKPFFSFYNTPARPESPSQSAQKTDTEVTLGSTKQTGAPYSVEAVLGSFKSITSYSQEIPKPVPSSAEKVSLHTEPISETLPDLSHTSGGQNQCGDEPESLKTPKESGQDVKSEAFDSPVTAGKTSSSSSSSSSREDISHMNTDQSRPPTHPTQLKPHRSRPSPSVGFTEFKDKTSGSVETVGSSINRRESPVSAIHQFAAKQLHQRPRNIQPGLDLITRQQTSTEPSPRCSRKTDQPEDSSVRGNKTHKTPFCSLFAAPITDAATASRSPPSADGGTEAVQTSAMSYLNFVAPPLSEATSEDSLKFSDSKLRSAASQIRADVEQTPHRSPSPEIDPVNQQASGVHGNVPGSPNPSAHPAQQQRDDEESPTGSAPDSVLKTLFLSLRPYQEDGDQQDTLYISDPTESETTDRRLTGRKQSQKKTNEFFHARRSCSQGDDDRFSHKPLNDLTKRLLDEALQREKELYEHMSKADEKSSGQPEDKEESKPSEPNMIPQIPIQPLRHNFHNSTETNNENGASHEEKPVDDADQPPVSSDHSQPVCYSVEAVLGSQISKPFFSFYNTPARPESPSQSAQKTDTEVTLDSTKQIDAPYSLDAVHVSFKSITSYSQEIPKPVQSSAEKVSLHTEPISETLPDLSHTSGGQSQCGDEPESLKTPKESGQDIKSEALDCPVTAGKTSSSSSSSSSREDISHMNTDQSRPPTHPTQLKPHRSRPSPSVGFTEFKDKTSGPVETVGSSINRRESPVSAIHQFAAKQLHQRPRNIQPGLDLIIRQQTSTEPSPRCSRKTDQPEDSSVRGNKTHKTPFCSLFAAPITDAATATRSPPSADGDTEAVQTSATSYLNFVASPLSEATSEDSLKFSDSKLRSAASQIRAVEQTPHRSPSPETDLVNQQASGVHGNVPGSPNPSAHPAQQQRDDEESPTGSAPDSVLKTLFLRLRPYQEDGDQQDTLHISDPTESETTDRRLTGCKQSQKKTEALQWEKELYEHMSKVDQELSGQPEDKESKPSEPNMIPQIPIQPLRCNFHNSTETNNENGASHEEKPVDDADQPPVSSDHSQPVCYSVEAVLGSQISKPFFSFCNTPARPESPSQSAQKTDTEVTLDSTKQTDAPYLVDAVHVSFKSTTSYSQEIPKPLQSSVEKVSLHTEPISETLPDLSHTSGGQSQCGDEPESLKTPKESSQDIKSEVLDSPVTAGKTSSSSSSSSSREDISHMNTDQSRPPTHLTQLKPHRSRPSPSVGFTEFKDKTSGPVETVGSSINRCESPVSAIHQFAAKQLHQRPRNIQPGLDLITRQQTSTEPSPRCSRKTDQPEDSSVRGNKTHKTPFCSLFAAPITDAATASRSPPSADGDTEAVQTSATSYLNFVAPPLSEATSEDSLKFSDSKLRSAAFQIRADVEQTPHRSPSPETDPVNQQASGVHGNVPGSPNPSAHPAQQQRDDEESPTGSAPDSVLKTLFLRLRPYQEDGDQQDTLHISDPTESETTYRRLTGRKQSQKKTNESSRGPRSPSETMEGSAIGTPDKPKPPRTRSVSHSLQLKAALKPRSQMRISHSSEGRNHENPSVTPLKELFRTLDSVVFQHGC
ncbi:uncharacterized protein KZ484_024438 [Pholidichthys leucotaenia]